MHILVIKGYKTKSLWNDWHNITFSCKTFLNITSDLPVTFPCLNLHLLISYFFIFLMIIWSKIFVYTKELNDIFLGPLINLASILQLCLFKFLKMSNLTSSDLVAWTFSLRLSRIEVASPGIPNTKIIWMLYFYQSGCHMILITWFVG